MEIRKYFKLNDNENTINQNLSYAAKTMLGGKVTVLNVCVRKEVIKISNLSF